MQIEHLHVKTLIPYVNNAREHSEEQVDQIAASIKKFKFNNPVLVDKTHGIIAGHGRVLAAMRLGLETVPCIRLDHLSEAEKKAYIIADNKIALNSAWNNQILFKELKDLQDLGIDFEITGFNKLDIKKYDWNLQPKKTGFLREKYIEPPFSILDTRKKEWVDRRNNWKNLIEDTAETRENVLGFSQNLSATTNSPNGSVFDATLAEVLVHWFTKESDNIFDPFAGGTFGFVSSFLKRNFLGMEIRQEQVEINQKRADKFNLSCKYVHDSCVNMDNYVKDNSVDLIFSCPPYANLEKYSNLKEDFSNMNQKQFIENLCFVLLKNIKKLKENRFFILVLSDVRDKKGNYINLIAKVINFLVENGLSFYNDCILVNSVNTASTRANKYMQNSRKVARIHQNVLVFLKGDAKLSANRLLCN